MSAPAKSCAPIDVLVAEDDPVIRLAVRLVTEDGLPYRAASWHLWRDHRVFVPFATLQNWIEAAGEKSRRPRGGRTPGLGLG